MNTPPPEITDPLLKSLVDEAAGLPRMAALEARKARKPARERAVRRSFDVWGGLVWLMRFRLAQAAVALLILAAMVEGGSLITGERSPLARKNGADLLSAATVTTKSGEHADATNAYWSGAAGSGGSGTWNTFASGTNASTNWLSAQTGGANSTMDFDKVIAFDANVGGTSSENGDGFSNKETQQPSQVSIESKFVDVGQNNYKELHFDYSLGTGNIGNIQYSGGNTVATTTTFPFTNIFGGGQITSGLRSGGSVPGSGSNYSFSINATGTNGNTAGSGITTGPGAGADTINAAIILGGNQTWTLNAAPTSPPTVSGAISGSVTGGNPSGTFNGAFADTRTLARGEKESDATEMGAATIQVDEESKALQVSPALPEVMAEIKKVTVNTAGTPPGSGSAKPAPTPAPVVDTRKLIRNAALDFEVASFEKALDTITTVAGEEQGYIFSQSSAKGANGKLQGQVIVKVLPPNLDRFLLKLRLLGDMKNQTVSAVDVSKDYYDTEARIRNSQVTEERLIEMMKTRTGKVSELLEVENEIARVRGEIEQMQGNLKVYDAQVQYATVTISLEEKDLNQAAAYLLTQQAQLSIFSKDVEKAFDDAKSDAADAKAQTLDSHLERDAAGHVVATIHLLIPPENADAAIVKLKEIGRIEHFNSQTQRVAKDDGNDAAPSDTAKVDRDKVDLTMTIQQDAENAVQGTNIAVQTDQVESKTRQIKDEAADAGVEVKGAEFNRLRNGVEISAMLLRMPIRKYNEFLEKIKALGKVKDFTVVRREDATATDDAPAEIVLQIYSQAGIVAPDTGLWFTVRHTLGEGMAALMWSLRMIGVTLAFIAPWAVIAGLVWLVAGRRWLARK